MRAGHGATCLYYQHLGGRGKQGPQSKTLISKNIKQNRILKYSQVLPYRKIWVIFPSLWILGWPWNYYVAEGALELSILPPPLHKCWQYRCVPSHLAKLHLLSFKVIGIETKVYIKVGAVDATVILGSYNFQRINENIKISTGINAYYKKAFI